MGSLDARLPAIVSGWWALLALSGPDRDESTEAAIAPYFEDTRIPPFEALVLIGPDEAVGGC